MSGIIVLILRILLMIGLYAFLGWAVITIWRDLRAQATVLSAPRVPALTLTTVEDETSMDGQPTQTFEVPEVVIGRSISNELPIMNETISARHARLSFHHNHWWLEDLNSTNGTFLNDERVSVPTVIVPGDELRVGQVSLAVEIRNKS